MSTPVSEHLVEVRGLLVAVLASPRPLPPEASLEVVAALNALTDPERLPVYPNGSPVAEEPVDALRAARARLRAAIPHEPDVAVTLRLGSAVRHLDAALAAVTW